MDAQLFLVFAALGDPTRLAMIERLSRGEATVQELMEPFDISGPAISRHLKVLEQSGLITRSRSAQTRPCRLAPERLQEVTDWTVRMRAFWDGSFDRMDEYLATVVGNKGERK